MRVYDANDTYNPYKTWGELSAVEVDRPPDPTSGDPGSATSACVWRAKNTPKRPGAVYWGVTSARRTSTDVPRI